MPCGWCLQMAVVDFFALLWNIPGGNVYIWHINILALWVWFLIQAELIEICRLVAESKLSEGKHQEALPAAQFCLRCSIDVHGPSTVQLVPAYLLLADAHMGEKGASNYWSAQTFLFCMFNAFMCVYVCVNMYLCMQVWEI